MSSRTWRSLIAVVGLAAFIVVVDQITKIWAQNELAGQPSIQVIGDLLQFTYALNPGAAFSLGGDYTWVFTIAATAVSVAVVIFAGTALPAAETFRHPRPVVPYPLSAIEWTHGPGTQQIDLV